MRIFLVVYLLSVLIPVLSPLQAQSPKKPNIVFILSDDHRADFMGMAGDPYIKTPRLDTLAEEGARFVNAFAVSATCSPSRASFWTGRYPFAAGAPYITGQNNTFLKTRTIFPELLQGAGYQTAFFGKWHMGLDHEPQRGFDHWAGWEHASTEDQVFYINGERVETQGFTDDALSEMVASYIRDTASSQEPFFLYMGLRSPHRPFAYPKRLESLLQDADIDKPETFNEDYRESGRDRKVVNGRLSIHSFPMYTRYFKTWNNFIKSYYRSAQSIDTSVGNVLDALREAGVEGDTIVVYSSDHGYNLGDHGLVEKHFAYEETMRIPFIMRWPGKIRPGIEPEALVTSLDLAPSLLSAAGVAVPENMTGHSLGPVLANPDATPPEWRDDFLFIFESRDGLIPGQIALRNERYKLVTYTDLSTVELYDLKKDPQEKRSVAQDDAYAEILKAMRQRLNEVKQREGYLPRPQRNSLKHLYVARGVTPQQAEALSTYYAANDFDPKATLPRECGNIQWELIEANAKGAFTPQAMTGVNTDAADALTLLAIPIELQVEEDPHVAIWVAPWPMTRMYWHGEEIWHFDPENAEPGNLANPPLDRSQSTVLLSVENLTKPLTIYLEAPRGTCRVKLLD